MEEWIPTHLSPDMPPGPTNSGASHWTRVEEWIPTLLSPDMPLGPTSPGQGSDQDGGVDTHSSESRQAPGLTSSGASHRTRVEEWIPAHLSPDMPLVRPVVVQAIRTGWRSGHPLVQVQRCPLVRPVLGRGQIRMEEWIPTHLSPEMPPGPTSPGQGSDQDGGMDTHSSEYRHAPGLTSSGASHRTRVEEWIPAHLSPDMPLVRSVVVQAIRPGWRSGHPLVQV